MVTLYDDIILMVALYVMNGHGCFCKLGYNEQRRGQGWGKRWSGWWCELMKVSLSWSYDHITILLLHFVHVHTGHDILIMFTNFIIFDTINKVFDVYIFMYHNQSCKMNWWIKDAFFMSFLYIAEPQFTEINIYYPLMSVMSYLLTWSNLA